MKFSVYFGVKLFELIYIIVLILIIELIGNSEYFFGNVCIKNGK